jgi:hypothetical protein
MSSDWQARASYTVADGLGCIASDHPDAVLVDLDVPPSGLEVLVNALGLDLQHVPKHGPAARRWKNFDAAQGRYRNEGHGLGPFG